ncbi:unnamed protein product [Prunus armeniaca]|uniref:Wall-associated receptor kinase galacturonan-binding domain-containing protein n=1 Tax=Prunus armeniaca TaxID=36596 RepID=A0A6J5XCZ6_PRUAR|nr:hypothetical protein GBA52_016142 [Prunus armeniaca]CAB4309795.1 unnamed protein product [Prunus armeniaca]CAB4317116.1 unnamed protein product [Prunus armeniaca]
MSHSGGAMKLMMVMMAMTLLTTSHGIGIPINTSVVTGGYSASRCNGLTDMGCRFAHSELDFDLEFMLDSEFNIRLLQTIPGSVVGQSLIAGKSVSCNRPGDPQSCRGLKNRTPIQEHCTDQLNRACHRYP